MPALKSTLMATLGGLLLSSALQAEPTNFRLGTGLFRADVQNGPDYLPDGTDNGITVFAEFPQSAHAGSRLMLYRINGEDGIKMSGAETQLMWGFNLNAPGLRAYTGPAWHYEKIRVQRDSGSRTKAFNGWGWHAGAGVQFGAVTFDIAATWRDAGDYNNESARAGGKDGDVVTYSLLASYRF